MREAQRRTVALGLLPRNALDVARQLLALDGLFDKLAVGADARLEQVVVHVVLVLARDVHDVDAEDCVRAQEAGQEASAA